ncbi:hypothetical protein [Polynucleobacter sphagniphilus]|uniref:hypothetical protein n=1 Tax=Polynucleobacter sphagniphilus TaxID=1743169 RepID=UPI00096B9BE0|nr:hypothetical protein [Polynucleobacter sphagniphilus]MDF9788873.1 hypothetical protein [Polynucleobacter sphagniphilus]MDH6154630.1 hypothetical protein [Polynucleobacter sphagniphilus]MDH6241391.1 hypothetical protein [Polynucleobacter sphagniphilus]MDH6249993.1 hypothetical protein [Polynucleobacter sphagniphilus]MDH6300342.1 hypothetical protein [Polynucleobacter sphagniphilus]
MKYRILLWILWPSFLVSGLAEGFLFSFVQPDDLVFFGHHPNISDEGIYTLGFFAIWIFCALSSALTTYILPGIDTDSAGKDRGLL